MPSLTRARRLAPAVFLAGLVLSLGACVGDYPNSTFNHYTDLNTSTDRLWDTVLLWGTIVFVLVEVVLLYTIFRFRKREGAPAPKMVHGNTVLEVTWTVLPVVILVIIAIPTVQTIFKTQAASPAGALEIEVIGHQWWWEYRYPQYGFSTANEMYVQNGRPVNLTLRTVDVLHAFWVPQLGGKRDLITNKVNHLWFTPNADLQTSVWNGFCTEYCGASHANMRIRAYTVSAAEFESWAQGQRLPAAFGATPPPAAPATPGTPPGTPPAGRGGSAGASMASATPAGTTVSTATGDVVQTPSAMAPGWFFPAERLAATPWVIPRTPIPKGISYDDALLAQGDAQRGRDLFARSSCLGCHAIGGVPGAMSNVGPNLTHVASRHTIAAGLYPNDDRHLARWIKNAQTMKPGVLMPPQGTGLVDRNTKAAAAPGYTDAQIADFVAFLRALK